MDISNTHGIYPPPNSLSKMDGELDLRKELRLEVAPGTEEWVTNRVKTPLARIILFPNIVQDAAPNEYARQTLAGGDSPRFGRRDLGARGVGPEAYDLTIASEGVTLTSDTPRGLSYGVDTLVRMIDETEGRLSAVEVQDGPSCRTRGVHLFLPPRKDLDFFIRLMEFLARYRYNTIFLETAAGMEFEQHPEINRIWETFSKELMDHPRAQKGLQESQWFDWKNDPHVELAGGSWLTKDETKRIADAAEHYGIEIIPEVQSLAHAYYLTVAHPEIAEAQDDPWPDTYCPSNPRSYELLFDVMREVMEVFESEMVHIGHDEVYTLHRCERCRDSTGAELFASDVNTIYDWLAERNVRTAMWADKLLDIRHDDGSTYGGVMRRVFKGDKQWVMPPTHKAVHDIPRDIMLLDWYWSLDETTPEKLGDLGFEDLIYGNFPGAGMSDWRERREKYPNIHGAEISTWVGATEDVLARSGQCIHQFIEGALTMWSDEYDPSKDKAELQHAAQKHVSAEQDTLGGRSSLFTAARVSPHEFTPLEFDHAEVWKPRGDLPTGIDPGEDTPSGIPFTIWEANGKAGCARVSFLSPIVRIPVNAHFTGLMGLFGTSIDRQQRSRNDELHLGKEVVGRLRFHYEAEDSRERDVEIMDLVYGETLHPWAATPRSYWSEPALTAQSKEGDPLTLYAVEWQNPNRRRPVRQIDLIWMGGRTMEGEICLFALSRTG